MAEKDKGWRGASRRAVADQLLLWREFTKSIAC